NGNGLPDAWEAQVAAKLGVDLATQPIRPGDLYPGTGMTFRDVYIAGIYTLPPQDGFELETLDSQGDLPRMAFMAVAGRTYTLHGSSVIPGDWTAVPFRLLPADASESTVSSFQATETRRVEIEAPFTSDTGAKFFRLMVE